MTIETLVTTVSVLAGLVSLSAVAYDLRSTRPSAERGRKITITIEDSSGARARMVTKSNRRVDDVKRDVERLVGQAY
ncbi:MAG TPA: hypothetical protein VGC13_30360 [Longimicrobium sp.]|jgi:hypothetical protein|uniref:hypothetical protein n=1 Tax=Longimicrobium sp. TaxID=2029185 RepID=UPI002ED91748